MIAWPFEHSKPDRDANNPEIHFKIRVETVEETHEGKHRRLMWEGLMKNARRYERKLTREERYAARDAVHDKDEL